MGYTNEWKSVCALGPEQDQGCRHHFKITKGGPGASRIPGELLWHEAICLEPNGFHIFPQGYEACFTEPWIPLLHVEGCPWRWRQLDSGMPWQKSHRLSFLLRQAHEVVRADGAHQPPGWSPHSTAHLLWSSYPEALTALGMRCEYESRDCRMLGCAFLCVSVCVCVCSKPSELASARHSGKRVSKKERGGLQY